MYDRAKKAAWECYVYCAFACGFFEGKKGRDLRARLASKNPDDFRSAIAECLACWFLAGNLGAPVTAEAPGRGEKMLDMQAYIDDQNVGVEVKAPYRECPAQEQVCHGHDADLLAQCLDTANKQFSNDVANILVLVPQLRTPVYTLRTQIVTALYGEEKITVPIDIRSGGPAGPVTTRFSPEGKLLQRRRPSGALLKTNGMPGFTRISAVIVIEEQWQEKFPHPITMLVNNMMENAEAGAVQDAWIRQKALHYSSDNQAWIKHDILVCHNPHACHHLRGKTFSGYIQFKKLGNGYGWSDGEPL